MREKQRVASKVASEQVYAEWIASCEAYEVMLESLHWRSGRTVPTGFTRITRGQPTSVFNHLLINLNMGLCISTTSLRQSSGRIGQGAMSDESQQQRYASFSCYA